MEVKFEDMIGKTFTSITIGKSKDGYFYGNGEGNDCITFNMEGSNDCYRMYHYQCCCENVHIKQIDGDLSDICNSKIIKAEEVTSATETPGGEECYTFYKIFTDIGDVTISWYGEHNGYYSVKVDFEYIKNKMEITTSHWFEDIYT